MGVMCENGQKDQTNCFSQNDAAINLWGRVHPNSLSTPLKAVHTTRVHFTAREHG